MYKHKKPTISHWAEAEQPMNKIKLQGAKSLSDTELLSCIIGTGTATMDVIEFSRSILGLFENDLNILSKASIHDLMQINGMTETKAKLIRAAFELGRRRQAAQSGERKQIKSSKDIAEIMQAEIGHLSHEEFWIICLNRANKVISKVRISSGGMTGTVADGKMIFRAALQEKACSIILSHNHPSGNTRPSDADISRTKRLIQGGKAIEIEILDHVIVSESGHYSFSDEGMI